MKKILVGAWLALWFLWFAVVFTASAWSQEQSRVDQIKRELQAKMELPIQIERLQKETHTLCVLVPPLECKNFLEMLRGDPEVMAAILYLSEGRIYLFRIVGSMTKDQKIYISDSVHIDMYIESTFPEIREYFGLGPKTVQDAK